MRRRINILKARQPWRPTAPVLPLDAVPMVFEGAHGATRIESPHMSFAPRMTTAACAALPAVCHNDRTARLQACAWPCLAAVRLFATRALHRAARVQAAYVYAVFCDTYVSSPQPPRSA